MFFALTLQLRFESRSQPERKPLSMPVGEAKNRDDGASWSLCRNRFVGLAKGGVSALRAKHLRYHLVERFELVQA